MRRGDRPSPATRARWQICPGHKSAALTLHQTPWNPGRRSPSKPHHGPGRGEPRMLATMSMAGPDDRDALGGDHDGRLRTHERRAWAVYRAGSGVVLADVHPNRGVVADVAALTRLGTRGRAGARPAGHSRARRAVELRGSGEQPGRGPAQAVALHPGRDPARGIVLLAALWRPAPIRALPVLDLGTRHHRPAGGCPWRLARSGQPKWPTHARLCRRLAPPAPRQARLRRPDGPGSYLAAGRWYRAESACPVRLALPGDDQHPHLCTLELRPRRRLGHVRGALLWPGDRRR